MPRIKGSVVKVAMVRAGRKRAWLADTTGISARTLTNALGPNPKPLEHAKIGAICDALGLSREDVTVDESDPPNPDAPDPDGATEVNAKDEDGQDGQGGKGSGSRGDKDTTHPTRRQETEKTTGPKRAQAVA